MHVQKDILFFADRLPPLIGGMEMHAKYFIEYFNDSEKFSFAGIITKNKKGDDILILNDKNIEININVLNKNMNPDVIFFNSGRWIEEFTQVRSIFPNAKLFYRTGGNEILKAPLVKNNNADHKTRQLYWVKAINDSIDTLITNSSYTEGRLRRLGIKIPFKRFVGGVNITDLKDMESRKNDLVTIFCAARFVPYKNHSLMVSVINELVIVGLKFRVKLAGDGPLFNKVKQQVQKYNLNSVVEFLGALDNSQTCKEIFNADIYMQFSKNEVTKVEGGSYIHSEGMGRSILEALSAGTFVIAGRSGALPEIVELPHGILLNLDENPRKIADHIATIVQNPPIKMGVRTNFSWKKIFTGYEKLFESF